MKTCLYQVTVVACLLFTACNERRITEGELTVIPVEVAFNAPTELKASDCFKQISYIPLETNDSCLVGQSPSVKILHDKLLVTTAQQQSYLFDRETGHFLTSVGHVGNDPEGYSDVRGCWLDHLNNHICFLGWNEKQVIYNADGSYSGELKNPVEATVFPANTVINYLDEKTFVAHSTAGGGNPDRVIVFRDSMIIGQFFPSGVDTVSFGIDPADIEMISVMFNKGFGPGMIFISYKNDKAGAYPMGDAFFWHQGKDLFFKEQFNDTIYQVTAEALLPVSCFDLGSYHWDAKDRFEKEKSHTIYPTELLEGKDVFIFRFITDLHKERVIYNAFYDKKRGTVKVSKYDTAFNDDLNGFLPLQPETVSPDGEFAQIVTADQIVSWFEENNDKTDLPAEIVALKKVGEEDNPVVMIMK